MTASRGDAVKAVLTGRSHGHFACFVVLALLVVPTALHASQEESQLYVKEGLVKLHAGQDAAGSPGETTMEKLTTVPQRDYQEAAALFNNAVNADKTNIYARYYLGVTRSRLGETQDAVLDLQAVVTCLEKAVACVQQSGTCPPDGDDYGDGCGRILSTDVRADLRQANLELGIVLVNVGRYPDALPYLEKVSKASEDPVLAAQASFFIGLARLRCSMAPGNLCQGDRSTARPYFEHAEGDPQLRVAARYYEGLIDYYEQQRPQAQEAFQYVVDHANPGSEMGAEAAKFLVELGVGRSYRLYAGFALEYDSNVVLAPSSDQEQVKFGITRQSDGRAVVTFGGRYVPWRTQQLQLDLGYDFYQSIYFQLTDFDLQVHRASAELIGHTNFADFGFLTMYDFDLFGTISLMQQVVASPWIRIPEGKENWGRAELFYRMRWQDYLDSTYESLDAVDNAVGGRQVVYITGPERFVWLGYRFDNNDATRQSGDQFGYNGNHGLVGVGWAFDRVATNVDLSYGFDYQDYDSASRGRHDKESSVTAVAVKQLNERFLLRGAYLGTFNDSNQAPYKYDRNIVSVGVEARF